MKLKHAWRLIYALPGADDFVIRRWGRSSPNPAGMAAQARYCYGAWMVHLIHAFEFAPPPPATGRRRNRTRQLAGRGIRGFAVGRVRIPRTRRG